jgi:hypothetical protein
MEASFLSLRRESVTFESSTNRSENCILHPCIFLHGTKMLETGPRSRNCEGCRQKLPALQISWILASTMFQNFKRIRFTSPDWKNCTALSHLEVGILNAALNMALQFIMSTGRSFENGFPVDLLVK